MKFDYDYNNDNLYVYNSKKKTKASVEFDNLVIDYTKDREITAIEFLNASEFLQDISHHKLTKEQLKNLIACTTRIESNSSTIKIEFTLDTKEKVVAPIIIPALKATA